MPPVNVVHLYLHEVPYHFSAVVHLHESVEFLCRSVEGEAQVAYATGLFFLAEEVKHTVLYIPLVECLPAATSYGVEEVVVEVVCLELLERIVVHLDGCLGGPVSKVGKLGGNVVAFPWMAAQGNSGGLFALALQVCGRSVEVIDSVGDGVVHHLVHGFLVYDVLAIVVFYHRPAHTAEAKGAHTVSVCGILTDEHALRLLCGSGFSGHLGCTCGKCRRTAYLYEVSSFHTCSSLPLTVIALMGLTGQYCSQAPQPMHTSSATVGRR